MKQDTLPLPIPWSDISSKDVVFDLDGTLVEGDLGETVFYSCLLKDCINERWPVNSQQRSSDNMPGELEGTLYGTEAKIFKLYHSHLENNRFEEAYGLTASFISEQADRAAVFTNSILARNTAPVDLHIKLENGRSGPVYRLTYGARFIPEMKTLAAKIIREGAAGWIVSASPQAVCEIVGEQLGFDRSRVIGVHDHNGEMCTPWGRSKVTALKERGVVEPVLAFGDSSGDRELLRFAQQGVLVWGCENRSLLSEAEKYGWFVLECPGKTTF